MHTAITQRWRSNRASYRPAGETIDAAAHEVAPLASDNEAREFIARHHYAGSMPAARRKFGLYRRGELAGVAVFSVPCNPATLACLGCSPRDAVELGRFVLLDEVEANGETWFLARCFEQLRREGFAGIVSFSDPHPRHDARGELIFRGHIGTIYQAHNARYVGRARANWLRMLPDGSVFHRRTLCKLTKGDRGWRSAAGVLETWGADRAPPRWGEAARLWALTWLEKLTRRVKHPGNHKYAWPLCKPVRRFLGDGLAYPKVATPPALF